MNSVSKTTLGELIQFQRGFDLPKTSFIKGDYPVISSNGILGYHNQYKVKGPGITIGRSGTVGLPQYIESNFFPHNTSLYIKDFKGNNPKYIYYLLKTFGLNERGSGSGVPTMNRNHLHPLKVLAHLDFLTQNKIASVLSSLDSKIEINNKIDSELELMAKTLYNYWFVQFNFPNKNGKPYKTSGGNMIYNEDLKREIPEGWEVKQMSQLLTKNTEKFNLNTRNHNLDTIDLSVMPSATMCLNEKSSSSSFDTNLFKLNKFDILFGGIRPYLLKAGFSPFDGLVTGTVHSFKVNDQNEYNFALITMVHDSMFKFAVSNSKGTKMPVVGADDLLCYKVAYNKDIIQKFNEIISFKEIISHNIIENQELSELRDWLLPMLMNGQVTVK